MNHDLRSATFRIAGPLTGDPLLVIAPVSNKAVCVAVDVPTCKNDDIRATETIDHSERDLDQDFHQ